MLVRGRWTLPVVTSAVVVVSSVAGSQSSQSSTSPIVQILLTARDARVRAQAATTLGRLRASGARLALETALGDRNPMVRAAAAQALAALADPAALPSLRAHQNDGDPGVRASVAQAVQHLERLATGGSAGNTQAVHAVGTTGNDWNRARFVVRVGTLTNRTGARPTVVDVLRNAIVQEVSRHTDVACAVGTLPPEAERRVRTGRLRVFAMEGGINTLRRWTVANTISVRAEVSLVLMTEPSRAIVGSLSGAATAQDSAIFPDIDGLAQRLEERALVAAVRGAMSDFRTSLGVAR